MFFGRLNILSGRCIPLPLIFFALVLCLNSLSASAQMDLPNPPANMENIPAGSFVIPMDTIHQAIVPAGDAPFNLKAYGLINRFLQNGIPVKWVIRSGKVKDGIDFSATASRIYPSALPSANVDFVSGPFIIPDTILPCGLSSNQIIQYFGNNVAVYQLQQSVTVDVRYTLSHRPKIAVFNNGGNQLIHMKILDAAGIPDYVVLSAAQISTLADCFTFASEPHADSTQVTQQMVNGIVQFVQNGGNFLAQCQAVNSYETQGLFHTTSGINVVNTQLLNNYVNADMAAAQIQGDLFPNRFGSCSNWTINTPSTWRPYYYPMVSDPSTDTVVFVAAHLIAANASGGNAFFLGGHDYGRVNNGTGGPGGPGGGAGPGGPVADLTDLTRVNGLRYYLNAVMIPAYNTNAAWANAGPDLTLNCGDSAALGCSQTGPVSAAYSWTPSAGLSCTLCPNPIAHPLVPTTYVVTVTTSCNATDTVTVNVNSSPVINVNNATICSGGSATLNVTGANTYSWSPSSGLSSATGNSVTASPASSTIYTVTGTAQNGCTATVSSNVVVNYLPVVSVNSPSICKGDTAVLTANGGITYVWNISSGLIDTSGNIATVQPVQTSSFTVSATDGNGCSSSVSATVTINDSVSMSASSASICIGDTATITIAGTPTGNIYSWSNGTTGSTLTVSPLSSTSYSVTGTSVAGCSASLSVQVVVNPLPVVTSTSDSICIGDYGTLTAYGAANYVWYPSGNSGNTFTDNPLVTTNYLVKGTSSAGCTGNDSATIYVSPKPVVNFNVGQSGCAPLEVLFQNLTQGANLECLWSFGDGTTSTEYAPLMHVYTVPGDYFVNLTVNVNGCEGNATSPKKISAYPSPVAGFQIADVVQDVIQSQVQLYNTSSGELYRTWNFGDGEIDSSGLLNPAHIYNDTGQYTICLAVKNDYGCYDSTCNDIDVKPTWAFYISNAFTPNADNKNEGYIGKSYNVIEHEMWIYDRWGLMIFDTGKTPNPESAPSWDGTVKGSDRAAQEDVYVWKVRLKDIDNKYHDLIGHVTVLR